MVKITDMIEIHEGVALMIGRHDDASGPNITPRGAMFAYAMGKYAPEYFQIDPPQKIYHSPISRARNTALMHRNALITNDMAAPDTSYDMRLHEQAGDTVHAAVEEIIREAAAYGHKTIEIITHSNIPYSISGHLGGLDGSGLGYGGMVVIKADSWEDMLDPKAQKTTQVIDSSAQLAEEMLGRTAVSVLNFMSDPTSAKYGIELQKLPEVQEIWQKAGFTSYASNNGEIRYDLETGEKLNAIIKAKEKESAEWVIKALKGEEVDSVVAPIEFMEMYDAYKYWMQNMALAVGINPYESTDVRLFDEEGKLKDGRGMMQSKMMDKLAGLNKRARTLSAALSDDDDDYLHPILNAKVQQLEKGRFTERKGRVASQAGTIGLNVPGYTDIMQPEKFSPEFKREDAATYHTQEDDDHPMLNALLAARMRAEARRAAEAKAEAEKAAKKQNTTGNISVKDMQDAKSNGGKA
ncbi:MAG: histidine phosphatase family protein [Alphaproteobacteria bacterium]|nr:histidine phosphatase family protein [Alphaproteobacteria bacterium]